jgi:hypothetical protein
MHPVVDVDERASMKTRMDSGSYREPRRSVLPALVVGIFIGLVAFAVFAHQAKQGMWDRLAAIATGRGLIIDNASSVVNKIQRLKRLETVSYSLDKIVEGDRQSAILPDFLVGDKLLMVVHGEVIAGIDLSQLRSSDVHINGRSIQVELPPSQVFLTSLDNTKTRVYSRTTGLLVPEDPNLESEVRAKAQQQIQQAAVAGGILATATKNARATVTSMLFGLGFQNVTVS